ncbi:arylsulfatase [Paracnuella aquatica]|uniref:arylsulfatase n=1 Tax=Paracnuella aquatica TaxID=2268757 RepID=UPI0019D43BC8|nr:arylsulfatase [Paracnuella aquatica]
MLMRKGFKILLCLLMLCMGMQAQRPNIVLIVADDLGYGDLGVYGQQKIGTPHLDKLAAGGMRFTNFYAGTSVCAPSRASLMTGLHTGHTPIRGNFEIQPEGQAPLPAASFTMAEMLQGAGYATGVFGKWGLGFPGSEGVPNKQGFSQFFGYNCQRQSHNFFPPHLWQNNQRVALANTLTNQQQYAPDLIQEQALSFLEKHKEQPFFLLLTYTLPHAGLQLPAGDSPFEAYKKSFNEAPQQVAATWTGTGYQPQAYPKSAYAAMVTKLDHYVGEVMAKLKALNLEQNTIVVFTSDNGPHREGGNQPEYFKSSGGLRGIKRDLYEGGIRVPMIAYWPSKIRSGSVSHYTGAFWDLMPTFAALTKQPVPKGLDGVSLLPVLTGKGRQQQRPYLYWEFHEDGGRQAVRMGKWKGVRERVKTNPNGPIQLFDLEKDPQETTDVSKNNAAIVQKINAIMKEAHIEHKAFPLIAGSQVAQ